MILKKPTNHFYLLFILICCLFSCSQENTLLLESKNQIINDLKNSFISSKTPIDSVYQQQIINGFEKGLNICIQNDNYSFHSDTLEINLFKTHDKYAFIRFQARDFTTRFGLFKITINKIEQVFLEEEGIGYSLDTIRDVNRDDFLDVVTSYYSSSGCCMRDDVTIRLYNPDSLAFQPPFSMMNPTFFPDEKIFYNVPYGHPGITPIKKYAWNNLDFTLEETLFPIIEKENHFHKYLGENDTTGMIIKSLPQEYKRVNGLSYFLDY